MQFCNVSRIFWKSHAMIASCQKKKSRVYYTVLQLPRCIHDYVVDCLNHNYNLMKFAKKMAL